MVEINGCARNFVAAPLWSLQRDPRLREGHLEEIEYGDIATLLSSLSRRPQLPSSVSAPPPSEFEPEDVGFEDNSWLARVVDVQGWLRLEDALRPDEREAKIAETLFTQLAPDSDQMHFTVADGVVRVTEAGVQALEMRLTRADARSRQYADSIEEGATRATASAEWAHEWDEPEASEPRNINASVDTWPIVEFVGHAMDNELDLDPPYQREYIWSTPDSQKLIESVLCGIPLPSIILASVADDDKLQIVDGKQRLTSLLRFVGAHPSAIAYAKDKSDLELFRTNFRRFAKKHQLTTDDMRTYYMPFKARTYDSGDPLRPVSGKFFDEIKDVQISIGGKPTTVRKLFESNASVYRIPILKYEDTDVRDIHKVFTIYNKQGVKLNAEEIRNAVYNHLKIMQLVLYIGGDRPDPDMARYAVDAGIDPTFAYSVINEMGFSTTRFRRSKVLLWMIATLLHPTGASGQLRAPSTATHIDGFLDAIEPKDGKLQRLKTNATLTALARALVDAIELHAEAEQAWHPRFRGKKENGKWEELGAVASLGACLLLVLLGKRDLLLDRSEEVRALTSTKKGPESTQNKTQWQHISDSLLSIMETLGVTLEESKAVLEERFGTSAIDVLAELRTLQVDG